MEILHLLLLEMERQVRMYIAYYSYILHKDKQSIV